MKRRTKQLPIKQIIMESNYIESYEKALDKMPLVFTSYDLGRKCRSMGVPASHTVWGISRFLEKRVGRISAMTWDKRLNPFQSSYDPQRDLLVKSSDYSGIFSKALDSMPNNFGSKEFISKCVKLGIPKTVVTNSNRVADFLKNNTERMSYRTWKKKGHVKGERELMREAANKMSGIINLTGAHDAHEQGKQSEVLTVESCIEFLKSNGYKVMKPVSEWVEI
jgi:hypothetical protein